MLPRSLQDTA